MEQKFITAWLSARQEAAALGIRMRPVAQEQALETAHRQLNGHRLSDGFDGLARLNRLELSLEALAVDKRFTALFSDDEVNQALSRLLEYGYHFFK